MNAATSTQTPANIIVDEAGYYFGDGLQEVLRQIDGIPNATYVVKDNGVFVFDKLVHLVRDRRKAGSGQPVDELARELVAKAIVSAKEAVDVWGIDPYPYRVDVMTIWHHSFNAELPVVFESKKDLHDALASLLVGGVIPGRGDFMYRNQPMLLRDYMGVKRLPPRPVIHCNEAFSLDDAVLRGMEYKSGFTPISPVLFDKVNELEMAWVSDSQQAIRHAKKHAASLWARASEFGLEALSGDVVKRQEQDCMTLRELYPELSMLSDDALFSWFDSYQFDYHRNNHWTPNRDDDFLFFLLGNTDAPQFDPIVGQWMGYALLQGDSLSEAVVFARSANMYDVALSSLVHRIANAMQFLAEDEKRTGLHGEPIITMNDLISHGSKSPKPLWVNHGLADFEVLGMSQ